MGIILKTDLPLELFKRGKVWDTWEIDNERLLVVSTDRISAFDVVMQEGIPGKGRILNQLSIFWFKYLRSQKNWEVADHFLDDNVWDIGLTSRNIQENDLLGRSMIVRRMDEVVPIECIMRGNIVGSAWKEYKVSGTVCGEKLRWPDLGEGDPFPKPIFTPSTKAETGHDENISRRQMTEILETLQWPGREGMLGKQEARKLTRLLEKYSRAVYSAGKKHAGSCGINIQDTKFEFGIKGNDILLIDEVLTPDSSRFLDTDLGINFDKQYVRDWLEGSGWDKESPPPNLPDHIIEETTRRYEEMLQRLTK